MKIEINLDDRMSQIVKAAHSGEFTDAMRDEVMARACELHKNMRVKYHPDDDVLIVSLRTKPTSESSESTSESSESTSESSESKMSFRERSAARRRNKTAPEA